MKRSIADDIETVFRLSAEINLACARLREQGVATFLRREQCHHQPMGGNFTLMFGFEFDATPKGAGE